MHRKEKEITAAAEIEDIINAAVVCRLAMVDGDRPYMVPLCFGYEDRTFYFHTALKGKKIDVLRKNPNVCFELEGDCRVLQQPDACDWGMAYRSVIGYGIASFVTSPEQKRRALDVIMRHYKGPAGPYPDGKLKATRIIRVQVRHMTGKRSPAPKNG